MPTHDRYARLTPFERALPDEQFPDRHFQAVVAEAEERGVSLEDPGVFAMLTASIAALEELKVPGEAQDDGVTRLAALLYHAFYHDQAGRPLLLVRTAVVRYLVDTAPTPAEATDGEALPGGVYVQLPQHLVWTRVVDDDAPRSLDGFFWTVPGDGTVHLLGVTGLHEERAGFTVIPLPGVPLADAALWARADMRPEAGTDFTTDMPGSEIDGLYEVRTAGELLKLGARLEAYLRRFPASLQDADPARRSPEEPVAGPRPSALAHRLVTLD